MKKLLTLTAVGAILAAPASAVQKCVALDAGVNGEDLGGMLLEGKMDWYVNFPNIAVRGVSVCLSSSSETIENMPMPDGSGYNCYCKMVSPAVSLWHYATSFADEWDCQYFCAGMCNTQVAADSSFRAQMYSSLSD
ncbi:MAG: hypothetical protein IJD41_00090 [Alphaproteobacteria bacterium]|nr:hypothetical protein [Alphaproteobacteria bacterium]MBQ7128262.1 hypothetical protein [Alphaproteobacteria bacterium]